MKYRIRKNKNKFITIKHMSLYEKRKTKFMVLKLESNSCFINDANMKHAWISSWDEIGHLESRHIPPFPLYSKCEPNYTITVAT